MNIPLDEVIVFDVVASSPTTGAASDADSTPTFAVYEETTDTDIGVGGNLTKRTSLTGNYRGSVTLSAANGFEVGKWYSIIASATVGGVAGKCVVRNFRVVAAEAVAGKYKVDVDAFGGTAGTFSNGRPEVNLTHVLGTLLTETSGGYLAAGIKKLFDVGTPVFTLASVNQTGDAFARIGSNGAGLTALGDTRMGNLDAAVSTRLATSSYSSPPSAGTIADAVLDEVVDGAYTLRQFTRLYASALAGKLSGAGTTSIAIRDLADTKDRIAATVDGDGNRSVVTLDLT